MELAGPEDAYSMAHSKYWVKTSIRTAKMNLVCKHKFYLNRHTQTIHLDGTFYLPLHNLQESEHY